MSFPKPNAVTMLAGGAIPRGSFVKPGADKTHCVVGAANTDRCIGIALNAAVSAEDPVEVALPGGGAYALLSENVVAGNDLVSHTDGSGALPNTAGDEILARCLEAGSTGELVPVVVIISSASASQ